MEYPKLKNRIQPKIVGDIIGNVVPEITISYRPVVKPSQLFQIRSAQDCFEMLVKKWNPDTIYFREEMKLILLNRRGCVLGIYDLATGGMHGATVDVKIILLLAIQKLACAIILTHNHPSGSMKVSTSDKELTKHIKAATAILEITFLDHIIISPEDYFSFADEGLL